MSDSLQSQIQVEVDGYKAIQREYQNSLQMREQLDGQLSENTLVKKELEMIEGDSRIFKLIGPALLPQDKGESLANVSKRIDYITGELKRQEENVKSLQNKQVTSRSRLAMLQQQFQNAHQKQPTSQ